MNFKKSEQITKADFLVVGAGIAGSSAAYRLSKHGKVIILEKESVPGYHTTGRSAAFFTENYGNAKIRAITRASRNFLESPPECFGNNKLMQDSGGSLFISNKDQNYAIERELAYAKSNKTNVFEISQSEALGIVPVIKKEYIHRALIEPDGKTIDVDLIHQGFLKGFKNNEGKIVLNAEVTNIEKNNNKWKIITREGSYSASYIINAAGAWGDEIGKIASCNTLGLTPKRRTVIIFKHTKDIRTYDWPVVIDIEDKFYFKPEAGKILASPADETDSPPCDAQPEEIDIALTVDRIENATEFKINTIDHKWAGLRSFLPNRSPAVFEDPIQKGFFWLIGQGGYGIMTSPAISKIIECLVTGKKWPTYLENESIYPDTLHL
ncbi:MAG: FAD-dependent catabolic D-arginine dehydrogenase DauA [Alphaproteobacteria bacterium MarineAlpha9_Bin1]|nr:MAG: FAD-dependent catabolic D-arginine dehydrogenase DauA [Alphaproteobacteria bacterium MarineAlpha9_Bin1]